MATAYSSSNEEESAHSLMKCSGIAKIAATGTGQLRTMVAISRAGFET